MTEGALPAFADLRLLATGRTAEVFELDDHRVLKLLRPGFPDRAADDEAEIARRVAAVYEAAPRCDGAVRFGGRAGVMYERIEGPTMDAEARAHPWWVLALGRKLGRLHGRMHAADGTGFRDQRAALHEAIDRATVFLTPTQAAAARARIEELAPGTRLCHGDLHPGNVILGSKPTVIDWENVRSGNPAADVARSIFLIRDAASLDELPAAIAAVAAIVRRAFLRGYLAGYRAVRPLDAREVEEWRLPILAARLAEGIVEEQPMVSREIDAALRTS
jgi:Ser/Thr protein kinase RdoA (MazF antagonist)